MTTSPTKYSFPHYIILQGLLNICYQPRAWKRVWALMIHKHIQKGDQIHVPTDPEFKAIMTKRFMSWAENTDQLKKSGLGNITQQMTSSLMLTQAICQAQRLSRCVAVMFLDIEKAFDTLAQWLMVRTATHERTCFVAQMDFQLSKG